MLSKYRERERWRWRRSARRARPVPRPLQRLLPEPPAVLERVERPQDRAVGQQLGQEERAQPYPDDLARRIEEEVGPRPVEGEAPQHRVERAEAQRGRYYVTRASLLEPLTGTCTVADVGLPPMPE